MYTSVSAGVEANAANEEANSEEEGPPCRLVKLGGEGGVAVTTGYQLSSVNPFWGYTMEYPSRSFWPKGESEVWQCKCPWRGTQITCGNYFCISLLLTTLPQQCKYNAKIFFFQS